MNDVIVFVGRNSLWLAGAAVVGAVVSGATAIGAYRESRTGFFGLVRETATRRAQRAAILTVLLLMLGAALGAMPRVVDLPPEMASVSLASPTPTRTRLPRPFEATATPISVVEPTLPASQLTPTAAPTAEAAVATPALISGAPITSLVFCKGISSGLQPIEPGQVFPPGNKPVYALFKFAGMSNGQTWSQVWTREGQEFKRREDKWAWGVRGSAYISALPAGGFTPGSYQVQLFVGGALVSSAQFKIE